MAAPEADELFARHRGLVFHVAYDILGTIAEAEDVAQETYLRWRDAPHAEIVNPRAYLARIAATQALNSARSAQRRREDYVGPWLPEPLADGYLADPEATAMTAAEVSTALLVVLQSLGPEERVAFVLHEVFGLEHAEVATALGRTQPAVRQLVHRARERVHAARPRFEVAADEHRAVVQKFAEASSRGDLEALLAALAPDVVLTADGGGKAWAALNPIYGPDKVVRFLLGLIAKASTDVSVHPLETNGRLAMLVTEADAPIAVFQADVVDGLIEGLFVTRNPDKLGNLRPPKAP